MSLLRKQSRMGSKKSKPTEDTTDAEDGPTPVNGISEPTKPPFLHSRTFLGPRRSTTLPPSSPGPHIIRKNRKMTKSWKLKPWKASPTAEDETRELADAVTAYEGRRRQLIAQEAEMAFDYALSHDSPDRKYTVPEKEKTANAILQELRGEDDREVYSRADKRRGHGYQHHERFAGDHFLGNVDLINQTKLFQVARRMPKGGHLHIHFNACLGPEVLLDIAWEQPRMFIKSNIPLTSKEAFAACEIQFQILSEEAFQQEQDHVKRKAHVKKLKETMERQWDLDKDRPLTPNELLAEEKRLAKSKALLEKELLQTNDIFDKDYGTFRSMPLEDFKNGFKIAFPGNSQFDELCFMYDSDQKFKADRGNRSPQRGYDWLLDKLVFDEDEVHDTCQTIWGAWEKFNGRTRMMKGLFNYESAFRKYAHLILRDFVADNIQYAEIRPNFMPTNQLWRDDGNGQLSNKEMMTIIVNEYEAFSSEHFSGLKVIYCTPRSFPRDKVDECLAECLQFKKTWPDYIAGFDLVGEEGKGFPLNHFRHEFVKFQRACLREKLSIPFLFHCGETLESGTPTDGNLYDALLLGSKRIGHGFALVRHPHVMQCMKEERVCLEVCPISNEVLGLTPRISGHAIYTLLANGVRCTVNSDNGTLFRSTLSHDFYQVFIGKADFSLWGWKQLIVWSLEHSCMSDAERAKAMQLWNSKWDEFIEWVIETFGKVLNRRGGESGEGEAGVTEGGLAIERLDSRR